jgi:hypothetical protein
MITLFGGLAIVCFAIGLGLVLNGLWFTRVPKSLKDNSSANEHQNLLDASSTPQLRPAGERLDLPRSATTSDLARAERLAGGSITEHTTHHLKRE